MVFSSFKYILLVAILTAFTTCTKESSKHVEIRGIYGNPKPLWDLGYNLSDLGINAIFVHSGSINDEMMQKARQDRLKVYAEFATLNGKKIRESAVIRAIDKSLEASF